MKNLRGFVSQHNLLYLVMDEGFIRAQSFINSYEEITRQYNQVQH